MKIKVAALVLSGACSVPIHRAFFVDVRIDVRILAGHAIEFIAQEARRV